MKKLLVGTGIAFVLVLAVVASGAFISAAYAQGPAQPPYALMGAMHNPQVVLDLLKINANDLVAQRKAGKSLLDIATAKGVSEKQLTDALVGPIAGMHGWMAQNYPQSGAEQMTQYMRDWIAKDIRTAQIGTMIDFRLGLSGNGAGYGMVGGFSGPNGFQGMMGGFNGTSGFRGGMMGSWGR